MWDLASFYIGLGYTHILPDGADHILFILGLFLLDPRLKPLLWQATVFTIAHTITLFLTAFDVIHPNPNIVEPLIAASIIFVAVENLVMREVRPWRYGVVMLFGLIHGMGFAGAIKETASSSGNLLVSLFSFNLGVECGQITIIAAAYLIIGKWYAKESWYRKGIVYPCSIAIALIALYWTLQRLQSP